MTDRHAYLILAHNEFLILETLVRILDDVRNDIYIHFDHKVQIIPSIKTQFSNLYIIEDRVNVSWGDVTVVEAEYRLFEYSFQNAEYAYYHLISGVDLPLKSQDEIHTFFHNNKGKEFIGISTYDYQKEVDRKVNYYHVFSKDFRKDNSISNKVKAILRAIYLRIQMRLGLRRYPKILFKKGTQWVSITHEFVRELVSQKRQILKMYTHTFCADEIYKQTICWNSHLRDKIFCTTDESVGCMRLIGWHDGQLKDWTDDDVNKVINSESLFARKFNSKNLNIVNSILKHVK